MVVKLELMKKIALSSFSVRQRRVSRRGKRFSQRKYLGQILNSAGSILLTENIVRGKMIEKNFSLKHVGVSKMELNLYIF